MERCIICNKKLLIGQLKYCSRKCNDKAYYHRHSYLIKERNRKWQEKNPKKYTKIRRKAFKKFYNIKNKRFKELMKKSYKKNKNKWISRRKTYNILNYTKKKLIIEHKCKDCGSNKSLQIHHEIYPTKAKKIRQAIEDKKIYFLCFGCHTKKRLKTCNTMLLL